MAVTGLQRPDLRTIGDFRKRHLEALAALFVQGPRLCRATGLVKHGHVALAGTRLKANASKPKAMSYGRMRPAEAALAAEVKDWLAKAEAADAAEDAELGPDRRGTGVLSVDGREVARNSMDHSTPITFPEDETFDVGQDTRTPLALLEYRYDVPFKFTGKIDKLTFELGEGQSAAKQ